jgi:hypothetical protein
VSAVTVAAYLCALQASATMDEAQDARDLPARTVYLQLEKIQEASEYDVQIRPYEQHWADPMKFKIQSEELRVRLSPGHYAVRTRSLSAKKKPGSWGNWRDFWVRFRPPKDVYPADGAVIDPKGNKQEKITFEWPAVPSARRYLLKLKSAEGKLIQKLEVTKTWAPVLVDINAAYQWAVIPLSRRDEADLPDNDVAYHAFRVKPPPLLTRSMYFEIEKKKDADRYQFEFVRFVGPNETGAPSAFDSREPNFRVRLSPGVYEMRARTFQGKQPSDWSPPQKFYIEYYPPKPILPEMKEEIEANDQEHAPVKLKWESFEGVEKYVVYVFDDQGKLILERETKENQTYVELPEDRTYKWKVVAYHAGEPRRAPASVETGAAQFSLTPYKKLELSPVEEPSQFYGWARLIQSSSSYEGVNYEQNAVANQAIRAVHGELAAGYWLRKSNLGLLVSGRASTYTTDTEGVTYTGAALMAGWRRKYENSPKRLRLWAGYAYNQIPELLGIAYDQSFHFTRLRNAGPQIQFSYMNALTEKLGWHAYGQAYYGNRDLGTPTGQPQLPRVSWQAGLLGTYKFDERYTGMCGYSYRVDKAAYLSQDVPGAINTIDYSGHYFSVFFQFAIEPAKK